MGYEWDTYRIYNITNLTLNAPKQNPGLVLDLLVFGVLGLLIWGDGISKHQEWWQYVDCEMEMKETQEIQGFQAPQLLR